MTASTPGANCRWWLAPVIAVLALGAVTCWTCYLNALTGVMLYDTNVEAFRDALTKAQRINIVERAQQWVVGATMPSLALNVAFAGYVCILSFRKRPGHTPVPCP